MQRISIRRCVYHYAYAVSSGLSFDVLTSKHRMDLKSKFYMGVCNLLALTTPIAVSSGLSFAYAFNTLREALLPFDPRL